MKKRIGRPSTGANITLTVHLTPVQYKKLLGLSVRSGLSLTAIVRSIVDKTQLKTA